MSKLAKNCPSVQRNLKKKKTFLKIEIKSFWVGPFFRGNKSNFNLGLTCKLSQPGIPRAYYWRVHWSNGSPVREFIGPRTPRTFRIPRTFSTGLFWLRYNSFPCNYCTVASHFGPRSFCSCVHFSLGSFSSRGNSLPGHFSSGSFQT